MTKNSTLDQLKKLQKNRIYLAMFVFLVVISIVWVMFSITISNVREQVDPKIISLSKMFAPVIDQEVFQIISEKNSYSDEELKLFPIYKIVFDKSLRKEKVVLIDTYLKLASQSGLTQP